MERFFARSPLRKFDVFAPSRRRRFLRRPSRPPIFRILTEFLCRVPFLRFDRRAPLAWRRWRLS